MNDVSDPADPLLLPLQSQLSTHTTRNAAFGLPKLTDSTIAHADCVPSEGQSQLICGLVPDSSNKIDGRRFHNVSELQQQLGNPLCCSSSHGTIDR